MNASTPAALAGTTQTRADEIRQNLVAFLGQRTKTAITAEVDIFATGLVSSLFALELVVHVEHSFGVTIAGPDLTLRNFRTVADMTALVLRLSGTDSGGNTSD